jgi:dienelactone hydrolase
MQSDGRNQGRDMEALRADIGALLRWIPPSSGPTPGVLGEVVDGNLVRKLITYTAPDGENIQSFLFAPVTTPRAAVVVLHQHNSDWSLGKSEVAGLAGDPLQAFGPVLARAGLAVLAPDALGFESRRRSGDSSTRVAAPPLPRGTPPGDWVQYYNHAMHRLVRGELLMSKLLSDVASAVSALQVLVPTESIGIVGHSLGGNLALFSAALDTRLSFAVTSGAVCSYRHKLAHDTALEMALVIPGFASRFDLDDLVRCVAPRKMLVVSSDDDPLSADATDVVTSARSTFVELGAADHLTHFRARGGHALHRSRFDAVVDWVVASA